MYVYENTFYIELCPWVSIVQRDYNNPVVPKKEFMGMVVLFIILDIFKSENLTKTCIIKINMLFKKGIIFTISGLFFTTLIY